MALQNGSDEYWKVDDHAKRIADGRANASSTSEREKWVKKGKKLADRLREDYGYGDECVEYLINKYGLDRD